MSSPTKRLKVAPRPSVNPDPSTAKDHHTENGFRNPWPSYRVDATKLDLFKMRFLAHPEKNNVPVPEGPNGTRSNQLVKVLKPTWGIEQPDKLRATWIGHASFLVEAPAIKGAERGVRVLFDPVFSERTSPFTFAGPKRYTPTPCTIDELPDVDVICISHNHYDHLDIHTMTPLYNRLKAKGVHVAVSLGVKQWFLDNVQCDPEDVTELDWWDGQDIIVEGLGSVQVTCTPAQHTSGRTIWDANKTLWCGWALRTEDDRRLYFAGDTAYQAAETPSPCPVFEHIGRELGPFDLAMIPIGLYSPPRFAAAVHCHPEQSFEIHKAVQSKMSIGMHYGTVRGGLSGVFEPVTDPPQRWRKAAESENMWCGGGVEGLGETNGSVDATKNGCRLCHVGETVAV